MAAGTLTGSGDALARRDRALELSGWGQPFRFVQPHNLCFWVYLALSAVGLVHLVRYFGPGSGVVGTGLAAGTIAVAIYGLLFLAFLRLTDHYERQPRTLVLAAFLWGGVAGTFGFALTANTAMLAIYPKLFGQAFGADWSAALTAPLTEETGKAAGFILLLGLAPRLIRSAYDGVFIGAFIGLGFQLFENVLYSFNTAITAFGVNQTDAALGTFAARAFSGVFSHTLFSALFCCGLIFAIGTAIQPRRLGLGIGLMVLAMIAHGCWDSASALGDGTPLGLLAAILVGIAALIAVIRALRRTAPQEREFLRAILEPEVENGTLTAEELDAVCAPRKQRRQFIRAGKGHKRHHTTKHVLRAALDLAHEIAAAGGRENARVAHERGEIERLRGALPQDDRAAGQPTPAPRPG